jgi:hypothetical protein
LQADQACVDDVTYEEVCERARAAGNSLVSHE